MSQADSGHGTGGGSSILTQPRTVWAIAFACVIAFMGIGLVDPILRGIADELHASAAQTELLFTSYLAITGVMMLITSFVSSRIGPRSTLLIGLGLIVVFSLLAALSGSVEAIIGFRAGWGFGNALFISTALATIVGAASGGTSSAIVLYEAALGIGIAIGPLVGGLLGSISWRGPFFGVAVLMAIAFVAILVMLPRDGKGVVREKTRLSAPLRALRNPTLFVLAVAALFYNFGFFTLLAFSPFAPGLKTFNALGLGFTFFGWGIALAVTSVWVAPWLTARLPRSMVLLIVMPLLAIDLVLVGVFVDNTIGIVVGIVVGGLFLGVLNTVLTEASMGATDLPRSVASSAYSFVRFIGGAVAPPVAAGIATWTNASVPFYVGAASVAVATVLILSGRKVLRRVDRMDETPEEEAEDIGIGEAA